MCGIVGFWGDGDADILRRMTHSLTQRGVDAQGFFVDQERKIFLGHRRLSIIDLADGQQPMWDRSGRFCVVFNGEIYNHVELRQQLIQHGHTFNTDHSDTEVLIHGYKQWGEELPSRLNGMFAFALYDVLNQSIFIARDRFGQKPLYYTQQNHLFAFASELKALLQHPNFIPRLNKLALKKFLAYGFLPAPHSQYQHTYKLPGGHWLKYNIATQKIVVQRYWKFSIKADFKLKSSEADLCEQLRFLLKQSVSRCSMSDVPLGLFLSGGIDSSTLLAFACQNAPTHRLQTFTIGFHEKSYDESEYAKQVADYFNTQHHQRILSVEKCRDIIPTILQHLDEPLGDASILPTYLVSELASQHVKVVLSGDGGDELFAGYDPFKALKMAQFYAKVMPKSIHRLLKKAVHRMPVNDKNMSLDFKIKRLLTGLSYPEKFWNSIWMSPLDPEALETLFQEKIDIEELYSEVIAIWQESESDNLIEKVMEYFTILYLQDDILTKVDRATMMFSLESRAPFLDNDLVEFVARLPYHYKYRRGTTKYILKKAMQSSLPAEILNRRKKGFGIPMNTWLREMPESSISTSFVSCNQDYVKKLWSEHRQKASDHKLFLWSWMVAEAQVGHLAKESHVA